MEAAEIQSRTNPGRKERIRRRMPGGGSLGTEALEPETLRIEVLEPEALRIEMRKTEMPGTEALETDAKLTGLAEKDRVDSGWI